MTRTDQLRNALDATPAPTPGAAIVRKVDPAGDLLSSMRDEFAKCLPDVLPIDMFMRVALTGFRKTPDLVAAKRASLLGALLDCARLGLAPCTEQASLVPFKGEVTLIVGYQGYVQLMYRSGQVEQVVCEMVYETDEWEYSLGDGGRFFHRPNILAEQRGKPLFAYAYASLAGGGRTRVAIVTQGEAKQLQREYGRGRQSSPWNSNFEAMWRKTAVRRVQAFAPKSAEMRRAVSVDGATYNGDQVMTDNDAIDGEIVDVDQAAAPVSAPPAADPPADQSGPWAGIEVATPGAR